MILARQGKLVDARQAIDPALEYHRRLAALGGDDLTQRFELAQALYAAALAYPDQRRALLAEAARTIDGLPAHMSRLRSVALVRGWIAEEQKRR
jgi:hypothetical protein